MVEALLRQIQQLQREGTKDPTPRPGQPEKTYIDPSRLPPAYRRSIEKYFQTLSEQP